MRFLTSSRKLAAAATAAVLTATVAPAISQPAAAVEPTQPSVGESATSSVESTSVRPGLRAVLQRDADALLPQGVPGVLAQVSGRHGTVRVRSGYGNLERRTPVPWNAHFRIGSLTKPFVSTTVLQLVGEGKLSLDDTVERWLPGLVRGNGNDGRRITVRQLLQHTSGLPNYVLGLPWLIDKEGFEQHRFDTVTARKAVRLAMDSKPDFAPGQGWNYSNTNYALAGMLIKRVTGNTWRHEVRQRIVKPLRLRETTVPYTSPRVPAPHAVGYERFPGPGATPEDPRYGEQIDATLQNPSWGGAAGAIISTTHDTNTFLRALVRGRLLKPAQLVEMKRTVSTSEAFQQAWPGSRYGLGIVWVPNSCGGSWSHGGDIMGYMTRNGVTPDGSRSVMVSFNTDSPKREPGVPAPKHAMTRTLIDHALCGVGGGS